jgi:hypothetical protein
VRYARASWVGGLTTLAVAACNASNSSTSSDTAPDATTDASKDAGESARDAAGDAPVNSGPPLTCPSPGSYQKNGGGCGTERWSVKTGQDTGAAGIGLVPTVTTIAALSALPKPSSLPSNRLSPVETTLWQLKDVTLTLIRMESDSDYHLVVQDGASHMIVEIPYPDCMGSSPWLCLASRARAVIDAKYSVGSGDVTPNATVSVMGVGFWDSDHGQTGVAPNAVELHSVLAICFGAGCDPEAQ